MEHDARRSPCVKAEAGVLEDERIGKGRYDDVQWLPQSARGELQQQENFA